MGDLVWQIKQLIRKLMPLAIVGAVVYGGYTFHKQGVFRHGPKYAVATLLNKVPVFGSRLRRMAFPGKSYVAKGSNRYKKSYRHGRRRHRRHR